MVVTLIMPTMNRPEFVERTLSYFRHAAAPWPILVLDGSDPEQASRTAGVVGADSAWGGKATYAAFPGTSFVRRFYFGTQQAKTPFTQLIADDDFTSPEFIGKAAALLDGDLSCAAAHGATTSFRFSHSLAQSRGEPVRFTDVQTPQNRAEKDAVSRILWFQGQHSPSLFYALRRTNLWRSIAEDLIKVEDAAAEWRDHASAFLLGNLYETLQDYATLIEGTVRGTPHIMLCRQYHPLNSGGLARQASDHLQTILDDRFPKLARIVAGAISHRLATISGREPATEQPLAEALLFLRFSDRIRFNTDARISELSSFWARASQAMISPFKPSLHTRLLRYALYLASFLDKKRGIAGLSSRYGCELGAIRTALTSEGAHT